jgi:hypothetical protein
MALTKQQKNTRAQKQSKKANAKTKTRYQQMIAERKAQGSRGSIDEAAFNNAANGVIETLKGLDCPAGKTGIGLVVRQDGYSDSSVLGALWNEDEFLKVGLNNGVTLERIEADIMMLVDDGEMNMRDFNDIDKVNTNDDTKLRTQLVQTSPEVRLLKAVSLFANIAHNSQGNNKNLGGHVGIVRQLMSSAIHRLIREIDPKACKILMTLTSMPASPNVIREMDDFVKAHQLVYMDIHDPLDSIIIMDADNNSIGAISLYHWNSSDTPLLMVAGGPKSEVPAGATVH